MKKEKLIVHGVASMLFGLRVYINYDFGARMLFWPHAIGAACFLFGAFTLTTVILNLKQTMRSAGYLQSSLLLILSAIGVVRDLQGQDNVLWIFAGSLYALTMLELLRGERNG